MNAVISSVIRTQSSNPAAAAKIEREVAKSAEEVTGGQNTAVESSVSSKYDTLELSQNYIRYKMQSENSTLNDLTSQLNSTVIEYAANQNKKNVVYNHQLYAYTESELLEMLSKGAITPEEYDEELSERDRLYKEREKDSSRSSQSR